MKMARSINAFLLLLLLHVLRAAYGANITVGGSSGWRLGFDYNTWAKGQTFTTNDVIVFNYGPSHSVDEVTDDDYNNCNAANPIRSHSSSPTSIPLSGLSSSNGTRYFICPTSNHCPQGMKLAVNVTAAQSPPPRTAPSPPPRTSPSPKHSPTSSTSSPPLSGPSIAPTPKSTSTPSPPTNAPPPVDSAGTIVLAALKSVVLGIALVVAALNGLTCS